jgi:hypothetical protein
MDGWLIFSHSARLVLRNWKEALQIGLVPIGLVVAVGLVSLGRDFLTMVFSGGPTVMSDDVAALAGVGVKLVLVWIFGLFMMLSVVVNWHRFVLLEAYPSGWLPPFHAALVLGYFGRIIMLVLIVTAAMVPLAIVAALLDGGTGGPGVITGLVVTGAGLFFGIAFYRVAAILPAGAIGRPITLGQAWQATQGSTTTIVMLVLVLFAVNLVLQMGVALLMLVFVPLGILAAMTTTVFLGLVSVSVLTTFYGVYIEGRSIG